MKTDQRGRVQRYTERELVADQLQKKCQQNGAIAADLVRTAHKYWGIAPDQLRAAVIDTARGLSSTSLIGAGLRRENIWAINYDSNELPRFLGVNCWAGAAEEFFRLCSPGSFHYIFYDGQAQLKTEAAGLYHAVRCIAETSLLAVTLSASRNGGEWDPVQQLKNTDIVVRKYSNFVKSDSWSAYFTDMAIKYWGRHTRQLKTWRMKDTDYAAPRLWSDGSVFFVAYKFAPVQSC